MFAFFFYFCEKCEMTVLLTDRTKRQDFPACAWQAVPHSVPPPFCLLILSHWKWTEKGDNSTESRQKYSKDYGHNKNECNIVPLWPSAAVEAANLCWPHSDCPKTSGSRLLQHPLLEPWIGSVLWNIHTHTQTESGWSGPLENLLSIRATHYICWKACKTEKHSHLNNLIHRKRYEKSQLNLISWRDN